MKCLPKRYLNTDNTAFDSVVNTAKEIKRKRWLSQMAVNCRLPGRQASAPLQTQMLSRFNGISFQPSNSSSRISRSFNSNTYWWPVLGFCSITFKTTVKVFGHL